MCKQHKKISLKEREQIFTLIKEGYGVRAIARFLTRSPSSISEELRRKKMTRQTYSLSIAQVDRNTKASLKGRRPKLRVGKMPLKLIKKWILENKWSPEQVSGRLKLQFKRNRKKHVSHETIYKYIYNLQNSEERNKYIKANAEKEKKENPESVTKSTVPQFATQFPYIRDLQK